MHIHYYFSNPAKAKLSGKESAIILEVYTRGARIRVNTGVRLEARHWDFKKQCAKKSYAGVVEVNLFLSSLKMRVLSALREEATKKDLSHKDIQKHVHGIKHVPIQRYCSAEGAGLSAKILSSATPKER